MEVVIKIEQIIRLAIMAKDLFPRIERFPDAGAFPEAIGDTEGDVVHLPLELRVFHHNYILLVLTGQVVDVIPKIGQAAVPPWVIGKTNDVEGYPTLQHIVQPEMRFIVLTAECDMQHDRTGG